MKIVKKIITAVLALAVFGCTLLLENGMEHELNFTMASTIVLTPAQSGVEIVREGKNFPQQNETELQNGDTVITGEQQNASVLFGDNGILRVAPQSKLTLRAMKDGAGNDTYVFILEQGRLWANTVFTEGRVNILTRGTITLPGNAIFDVDFDEEKTRIQVIKNQLNIGLIPLDFSSNTLMSAHDTVLINSFLVAQGSETTIFTQNIKDNADALRKLLYSKLIKEFQYALLDKTLLAQDPWIQQNVKADEEFIQTVAQKKLRSINGRNLKIPALSSLNYQLQKATDRFATVLTFSDEKVLQHSMDTLFDQLLDAEYLLLFGRTTEAKERLDLFRQQVEEKMGQNDSNFRSLLLTRLRNNYEDLAFVLPNDPLFEVKMTLSDILLQQLGATEQEVVEKFLLIRDYMNFAYNLADKNALLARLTLEQYYTRFSNFVTAEKARISTIKDLISEENQIMDNLLRQFPQFYQDGFFAMKHALETEWLALLPEGDDKNEERQTISSTKIDFLKQLQNFFLDGKVSLKDARLIAFRLINEIKDLQTDTTVGVTQLFALRLKDYGQFLRFLNSTELATLQGASFRKKYDEFLAAQKEQISIEQAVQEFLGEQPTPQLTSAQILEQVRADFVTAGVTNLILGDFSDINQQFIAVHGKTADGISFDGQYDWDRKLISDVKIGMQTVSAEPTRLDVLPTVVKPKVTPSPSSVPTPTPESTEELSKAEKVAKILLLQKLKTNDIAVKETDIKITSLSEGIFQVKNASLISKNEIIFRFTFKNKESVAQNIIVKTAQGDRPFTDLVPISGLSEKITEIYNTP